MDYDPLSLVHKGLFKDFALKKKILSCDFSFATIFTWRKKFHSEIALFGNSIIVKFINQEGQTAFLAPIGGDISHATEAIINYCTERSIDLHLHAITKDFLTELSPSILEKLSISFDRNQAEYIYNSTDLATLTGTKLKKKRNHINRFLKDYPNYTVEPITSANIKDCLEIYKQWRLETQDRGDNPQDLEDEQMAIHEAFNNFEALDLQGIILKINSQSIAFAFGEMITPTCFLTHTEKALTTYPTAYAMINKLTAEHLAPQAIYINREEDMGIENLRKAKLSYYPTILLEKATATLKEVPKNTEIILKHIERKRMGFGAFTRSVEA